MIHKPNLIVLDEATSALDPEGQERLMRLVAEKIPAATVISVGHRPELEAFHERKLVLKHQKGGARLIRDEYLSIFPGPRAHLVRKVFDWGRRRFHREEKDPPASPDISGGITEVADVKNFPTEKTERSNAKQPGLEREAS
jgi:putative ATP-binding cassette transporter